MLDTPHQIVFALNHIGNKLGAGRLVEQADKHHTPEAEIGDVVEVFAITSVVAVAQVLENLENAHRLVGEGNKLCLLVALGGHRRIIADLRDELEPHL
ncbi:hypothetical protein [Rhizobium laguerreae]|uniref:hypothetical protein n=1 Tax=Rhizobium laguerreae TaxID=1076926 RepID=UPI001FEB337B|nr:hypothetical protein [Rhizobium laguerreae]